VRCKCLFYLWRLKPGIMFGQNSRTTQPGKGVKPAAVTN